MTDYLSRALIEHLIDRQVCNYPRKPCKNACRNDGRLDKAIAALTAAEYRIRELEEALEKIGLCTAWIGVPVDTEAASYLGQTLQELVFIARAALSQEKK